ncbi:MarR family winged helix-turn-helix transcriptional regulator [Bdellovibrio reynosensis]|uniref:MarR family transcriptional regulator n=1 Tax=Bdellovibrio reynosensis TaxID=2835041 RepID=A0ABY4C7F3_9BACT|nr:MarR family transcriptional regulator [Bdellovibrio reynosensis]UOE99836.1 MarR family transcriptional regulator [Bdellovibrio reynosensis]
MAKLFFTEIPTYKEIQESAKMLHPELDHLTFYSHILLRKISTDLEVNLDKFFSQYNLSSGRFALMLLLNRTPGGLMPSEIAQKVGVTQATISGLINSLEKAELVKRTTHEKDGRSFVILLTEKGIQACQEIAPLYHERISKFWSDFSVEEKQSISSGMEKLIKSVGRLGQTEKA